MGTSGIDGLGRGHRCCCVEVRTAEDKEKSDHLLAVAVAWNDTSDDGIQKAGCLPRRRSTFSVTEETLLRHDGHSVARSARDGGEDLVPDVGLVLLLLQVTKHVKILPEGTNNEKY